jgi:hypothetical protein
MEKYTYPINKHACVVSHLGMPQHWSWSRWIKSIMSILSLGRTGYGHIHPNRRPEEPHSPNEANTKLRLN